jgi:guanylate kinase
LNHRGALVVVSGTGGAGKGSVVDAVRARYPDLWWSVSWATRAPRTGERDGEHYWFKSRDEFEQLRAADGFLEWADVYGVLKGTPRAPLADALSAGRDVLLEMDIQGVTRVLEEFPDAEVVFLVAPGRAVQEQRLRSRGTDTDDDIRRRLDAAEAEEAVARDELAARHQGLRIVVNEDLDQVVDLVAAIIDDRRRR